VWWWSIFKNYYHIAGDYRITLPRPKLRFRRRGGSERLLKAKQFESNMLNNWAAIRITHVPINHAVARRHDSTSSLQTPYLDYRASWNFPSQISYLSAANQQTTGHPKRPDERESPSDINILPGWKSNGKKQKWKWEVPETETRGQSQSQDHHAVSSWTHPFRDPGNNLI